MRLRDIYDAHADALFPIALRLTGSVADAEDVLQDVFIKLPRALATYRGEGSIGGWLRVVTTRTALELVRKRKRRLEFRRAARDSLTRPSPGADPLDLILLDQNIMRLPDHLRVVLVLRLQGYTHAEIAARLEIAKATSMGRLCKAKARLRRAMSP